MEGKIKEIHFMFLSNKDCYYQMKGVKDNIFLHRPTLTTAENSSHLSNDFLVSTLKTRSVLSADPTLV